MFSSCFPVSRGFSARKPWTARFFGGCRRLWNPPPRRLWPILRRSPKDSTHGTGQDLVHGEPRATSLQEAQVPHDSSRAQDALRVSASEETPHPGSPGPHCCPASPLGCLLRELLAKGSDAPSPPSAVTTQALPWPDAKSVPTYESESQKETWTELQYM
ncbi:CMT1A duplicated region transcript 15 protein-like protein isoform X1 [Camelus ferus]|uniref:CMT1A duplicated region transcript 15 protein-like protein isoform X1 n=1 Tax=Camelus ferus TaxID=419612 RepID=A0A8B8U021_CAMFR|nr:CMT1A duplicated region transcript 15 protein-like protein isoform X1 [Camelus ferus]